MQKYVMIALFYTTISFGAQTYVVPVQAPTAEYVALMMHTQHEASTWSFVPSDIEQNLQRHRIGVAALLDEPEVVPLSHEIRKLYGALFPKECKQVVVQNVIATPEQLARFKHGYRSGFRRHGYMRGHKKFSGRGRRYVHRPKESE